MTLSLPTTARPLAIVAALAWTALSIGAAVSPSSAQAAEGAYYRAQLSAPATNTNAVVAVAVLEGLEAVADLHGSA
jgi:hypothetical protein